MGNHIPTPADYPADGIPDIELVEAIDDAIEVGWITGGVDITTGLVRPRGFLRGNFLRSAKQRQVI